MLSHLQASYHWCHICKRAIICFTAQHRDNVSRQACPLCRICLRRSSAVAKQCVTSQQAPHLLLTTSLHHACQLLSWGLVHTLEAGSHLFLNSSFATSMQRWVVVLLLEACPVLCLLNLVECCCHLQRKHLLLTKLCGHKVTFQKLLVVGVQYQCQLSQGWAVNGCSIGESLTECLSEACCCRSAAALQADMQT